MILAREIESGPRLMIAVQPTRGLDVGAVETAHKLLLERRAAGAAILLISEELDELLALADRIAVLYEGRIVGIMDAADADVAEIGLLMTGGTPRTDQRAGARGGRGRGMTAATRRPSRGSACRTRSAWSRASRRRAGCRPR